MNRTIFLARPDPIVEDLYQTAESICNSFQANSAKNYKRELRALA